jgi:hypothetical protein
VTIVGHSSFDAAIANRWCDSQGIDADNCFVKMNQQYLRPRGNDGDAQVTSA